MYVELFCGAVILFFTFLEFNNRNALFLSGEWELSNAICSRVGHTILLLFIIIIFIATTLTYYLRNKFYYLQLFMGSILFFKF